MSIDRNIEKNVAKAYRHLFQSHRVATDVDRNIHLADMLQNELSNVPLALADMNGNLGSATKSHLSDVLQQDVEIKLSASKDERIFMPIDGPALIQTD